MAVVFCCIGQMLCGSELREFSPSNPGPLVSKVFSFRSQDCCFHFTAMRFSLCNMISPFSNHFTLFLFSLSLPYIIWSELTLRGLPERCLMQSVLSSILKRKARACILLLGGLDRPGTPGCVPKSSFFYLTVNLTVCTHLPGFLGLMCWNC